MNTQVLVLGGNGFIGSHLVRALVRAGARVRVLDRGKNLLGEPLPSVDYRCADFDDTASLAEALADVDLVIHLISTTVPGTGNLDPIADIEGNLVGTVRLLQQMRELGVPRLIFLSSGGTVYGDAQTVPIPEEHALHPRSSYGIVKVAIEHYMAMFASLFGLRALVLRVSNPYGPEQGHLGVQGVIATFFKRTLVGDPIKIWGDGSAVRDYIYIDDLVAFILDAVRMDLEGVFNVGSGQGTSLCELLSIIAKVSRRDPEVSFLPARGFDVHKVVLDTAKAHHATGWSPKVSLLDGCERYWAWLTDRSGTPLDNSKAGR